ncbi:hypothetical protein ZWY2020_037904 [Hordeum vulgare]|nr:hypothetical protein ZWY2020_037904 [Hordeum vulgare]
MKDAAAAAKRYEEMEACFKVFQEEQAKLPEQLRLREEELEAHRTKLAAREEELSKEETRGEALAAAEKKKAAEFVNFLDVELRLCMMLHTLYRDGFGEPLATPDGGFAILAAELPVALEDTVIQVDNVLNSECRDLFSEATTRVFSHLHLREPGFDLGSRILLVSAEARDGAAEAVKGLVEALVKMFSRVVVPPSPDAAEADGEEDDATDADDKPPEDGAIGGGGSS